MRILHITDRLGLGGKERRLVELLKGLKEVNGFNCQIAVFSKEIFYDYIHTLDIKIHYIDRLKKTNFHPLINLFNICKEFKPDIIHTWESMCSIYAVPIAKLLNIKLVNGLIKNSTNLKVRNKDWIRSKITFPFSDIVVSNSIAGLKAYNAPLIKSYCVYNGFDFFRKKNIEKSKHIKEKFNIKTPKVIGMVASFNKKKDYHTYFKVAMNLLKSTKNISFIAVGDGETLTECKKIIKKEFRNNIKFLGKQKDIENIINILDIGVLLTNQNLHGEGISNSIMEYMALGKPVIATLGGGNNEIVVNGKTGFLIDSNDVDEISQKIGMLISNEDLAFRLGRAGEERISKNFNLNTMVNEFLSIYNNCLEINV